MNRNLFSRISDFIFDYFELIMILLLIILTYVVINYISTSHIEEVKNLDNLSSFNKYNLCHKINEYYYCKNIGD